GMTALGLVPQRVVASVAGGLGSIGLLLAAIGIYGVTVVLGQGIWLIAVGLTIGLALAAGVSQLLTVFLFGVPPLDPATFTAAVMVFAAVGLVACSIPTRGATNIDP